MEKEFSWCPRGHRVKSVHGMQFLSDCPKMDDVKNDLEKEFLAEFIVV